MEGFGGTGQATEGNGGGSIINSARTVFSVSATSSRSYKVFPHTGNSNSRSGIITAGWSRFYTGKSDARKPQ